MLPDEELATNRISTVAISVGRYASIDFGLCVDDENVHDEATMLAALGVMLTAVCDCYKGEETTEERLQKVHDLALEFLTKTRSLQ